MKSKLLVGLGVLVLSGVSVAGFAATRTTGPNPERAERFINWRVNEALDDLDATPDQRTRILALKDRSLAEGRDVFKSHAATRTELKAQWDSPKPDSSRVHALIDERTDAMRGFAHKLADAVLEVHNILTPEQRSQVSEEISARHGHCGHGG